MRVSRARLLFLAAAGLLLASLGTTMTAAMNVPLSHAGVASMPFDARCMVEAAVTFKPQNLNRIGVGHQLLTVAVTFPAGTPPEVEGAQISGVTMSLPGGTQSIASEPADGWNQVIFTRDDVLDLVGPVSGNVTVVVGGYLGPCTFSVEHTFRINGPV